MPPIPNPWLDLPHSGEYVAPCDRAALDAMRPALRERLRLRLLPAPYAGARDAAVLLLLLNPGHKPEADTEQAAGTDFYEQQRAALAFTGRSPNYLLEDAYRGTAAHNWYARTLKGVIELCGADVVARRVLLVQLFPYRSVSKPTLPALPSQAFTFQLAREALARRAEIIIGRSQADWLAALPELRDYPFIMLRNKRNPTVSRGNMEPEEFERVLAALRG